MRLSTEKYFVLLSLYVAFILFRTPPRQAAALVAFNARVSGAFARLILYTFPAVCWVYGAGLIFSTFVSGRTPSWDLLKLQTVSRCLSACLVCQPTASNSLFQWLSSSLCLLQVVVVRVHVKSCEARSVLHAR